MDLTPMSKWDLPTTIRNTIEILLQNGRIKTTQLHWCLMEQFSKRYLYMQLWVRPVMFWQLNFTKYLGYHLVPRKIRGPGHLKWPFPITETVKSHSKQNTANIKHVLKIYSATFGSHYKLVHLSGTDIGDDKCMCPIKQLPTQVESLCVIKLQFSS